MKKLNEQKGSVTIYLGIIFMAMVLVVGLFIDLARIKAAQNQFRRTLNASARSVMANYDTRFRTNFGLFKLYKSDNKEFQKYILTNVSSSNQQKNNLLDFRYEGSSFQLGRTLLDDNDRRVLKQQILEDMKYRAPLELTRELIDKFMQIRNATAFYTDTNEKRKSINTVNDKFVSISENNKNIQTIKGQLSQNKTELKNTKDEIKKAQLASENGRLRSDIKSELDKVSRTRTEIDVELSKMEKTKTTRVFDNNNPAQQGLGVEDGPVKQSVQDTVTRRKEDLNKINAEIKQSEAALKKEGKTEGVSPGLLTEIGINSADVVNESINQTVNAEAYRNPAVERKLRQEASALQAVYSNISSYLNPVAVNGNRKGFEITDGPKADSAAKRLTDIFEIINVKERLIDLRDEILINEYALTYLSMLTDPRAGIFYPHWLTETEFVCYGEKNPMVIAITDLYMTRFALDSMAYFAFSKLPPEPLQRTIYSLIMGALQAVVDTYKLVGAREAVPVAVMYPENPLANITVNYKDHLRLFLLLNSNEEGKLKRITHVITERGGVLPGDSKTWIKGRAETSIKMWFLPLAGIKNLSKGPFGTVIKNGRCYIAKEVEYGY
jgi:hypothetical protein